MSKTILVEREKVERKDINLANKLQSKIPVEYTAFRDTILKTLREMEDIHCNTYVPQLYSILRQAGLSPREARAVVRKDGTELFHWSPITIDKAIKDPEAKDQVKSKAGKVSAEVKKVKKQAAIANAAVEEATHRGPGRPRKPEEVFSVVVDCSELIVQLQEIAKTTDKAKIEISASGKLNVSALVVAPEVAA